MNFLEACRALATRCARSVPSLAFAFLLGASACGGGNGGGVTTGPDSNPPPTTGSAVFWTDNAAVVPITVLVNGQVIGTVPQATDAVPACGETTGLTFTSSEVGNPDFTASSPLGATWHGSVAILRGGCFKQQLTYSGGGGGGGGGAGGILTASPASLTLHVAATGTATAFVNVTFDPGSSLTRELITLVDHGYAAPCSGAVGQCPPTLTIAAVTGSAPAYVVTLAVQGRGLTGTFPHTLDLSGGSAPPVSIPVILVVP